MELSELINKPMSPDQLVLLQEDIIPDEVFAAVNVLLAESYTSPNASITINSQELIEKILENFGIPKAKQTNNCSKRKEIWDRGWLNIEECYRKEGWSVAVTNNDSGVYIYRFTRKSD